MAAALAAEHCCGCVGRRGMAGQGLREGQPSLAMLGLLVPSLCRQGTGEPPWPGLGWAGAGCRGPSGFAGCLDAV